MIESLAEMVMTFLQEKKITTSLQEEMELITLLEAVGLTV